MFHLGCNQIRLKLVALLIAVLPLADVFALFTPGNYVGTSKKYTADVIGLPRFLEDARWQNTRRTHHFLIIGFCVFSTQTTRRERPISDGGWSLIWQQWAVLVITDYNVTTWRNQPVSGERSEEQLLLLYRLLVYSR